MTSHNVYLLIYRNESCPIFFTKKFIKFFKNTCMKGLTSKWWIQKLPVHCAELGTGKWSFFILSEISTNNSILRHKKRLSKHLLIRVPTKAANFSSSIFVCMLRVLLRFFTVTQSLVLFRGKNMFSRLRFSSFPVLHKRTCGVEIW